MSSDDKIPGIRKNGPQPTPPPEPDLEGFDFMDLTDDQQRAMLNQELTRWQFNNLNVGQVPHNIFNMDAMLIALVRVMTKELNIPEDVLNRHYRHVTFEKLQSIRQDAMKSKIIRP